VFFLQGITASSEISKFYKSKKYTGMEKNLNLRFVTFQSSHLSIAFSSGSPTNSSSKRTKEWHDANARIEFKPASVTDLAIGTPLI
jgi:hypothetical protein